MHFYNRQYKPKSDATQWGILSLLTSISVQNESEVTKYIIATSKIPNGPIQLNKNEKSRLQKTI